MAPKPRRLTVRSPPTSIVPAFPAWGVWTSDMDHDSFDLRLRDRCHGMWPIALVAALFKKGYAVRMAPGWSAVVWASTRFLLPARFDRFTSFLQGRPERQCAPRTHPPCTSRSTGRLAPETVCGRFIGQAYFCCWTEYSFPRCRRDTPTSR